MCPRRSSTRRASPPTDNTRVTGVPLLTGHGLARRYGAVEALAPTDIAVARGERIALTGPNGAGKTTLLSMLAGVGRPSAGEISWHDGPPAPVGWAPQRPALYPRLTARENLRLFAGLEGADDAAAATEALLGRADLRDVADRPARALSTGTLQRLNLAIALAGAPDLLLLDEPTATLSPDQRHRLWAWLTDLVAGEGMSLIFSTQSIDEAARHADRILVLARGRLMFDGTVPDLIIRAGGDPDDPVAGEAAFMDLVGGEG